MYFDQDTIKAIKAIPICPKANLDKWIWLKSCHGDHTLKSAYWALQNENLSFASNTTKGNMWNTKIHERLKMHLWIIVVDILPTQTQLSRFVSNIDPICPLCELAPESSLHLFQHFPVTQSLWFGSCWGLRISNFQFSSTKQLIDFIVCPPNDQFLDKLHQKFTLFAALLMEHVWSLRNKATHGGGKPNADEVGRGLQNRFFEHWPVMNRLVNSSTPSLKNDVHWVNPVKGEIKINCDAAMGVNDSMVAGLPEIGEGNWFLLLHSE